MANAINAPGNKIKCWIRAGLELPYNLAELLSDDNYYLSLL